MRMNHTDTVRVILARAHPADGYRLDCLLQCFANEQHAIAALLIAAGMSTEAFRKALYYAAYYEQPDAFKLLLESTSETDRQPPANWRATDAMLYAVAVYKDERMAKLAYAYGMLGEWRHPPTLRQLAGARVPMRTALRLLDGSELAPTDVYEYIYFPDHPNSVPV